MAENRFQLTHGLRLGEEILTEVVLRELTTGDIIDARVAGEKLVWSPRADGRGNEPVLVESPALVDAHLLCAQIKRIGDVSGPFDLKTIGRLHPEDFAILLAQADVLDGARSSDLMQEALGQRGRDDPGQPGSAGSGPETGDEDRVV